MKQDDIDYRDIYYSAHQCNDEALKRDIEAKRWYMDLHHLFPDDKNSSILDIGSANGATLMALGLQGYHNTVGVELFKDLAEDSCKNHKLNVICSDIVDFFHGSDKQFDVIFAFDVLEHLEKDQQIECMRQIYDHLTERGYFALSTPNALNPCFSWIRYGDWTHRCVFTDLSLSFLFKTGKFRYFSIGNNHDDLPEVRSLKRLFYDMLTKEHHYVDPILTPNLFGIGFKKHREWENYLKKAPLIKVDYTLPSPWETATETLEKTTNEKFHAMQGEQAALKSDTAQKFELLQGEQVALKDDFVRNNAQITAVLQQHKVLIDNYSSCLDLQKKELRVAQLEIASLKQELQAALSEIRRLHLQAMKKMATEERGRRK